MRFAKTGRVMLYHLSRLVPRSPRQVLFGAWHGHRFSDNSRYLYEYLMAQRPELRLAWCGEESLRDVIPTGPGARFVRRGSVAALVAMLRAGTVFVTHGYQDVAQVNLTSGAQFVYLGHGLAIKRMGSRDHRHTPASSIAGWAHRAWRAAESFTSFIASSEVHRRKLLVEFASQGARRGNTFATGQPRCDEFVDPTRHESRDTFRGMLQRQHDVPETARLVVYMPTFRDLPGSDFSFSGLRGTPAVRLRTILQRHDAVLVERRHFVDSTLRTMDTTPGSEAVFDLSSASNVDSNELLLGTELLITDYSGAFVDFLLLDRPVLHYVYDLDQYVRADRGLYFDLAEVAGGPLLEDVDDLLDALDAHLADPSRGWERRQRVRQHLLEVEAGRSCQNVTDRFLGMAATTKPPPSRSD